MTDRYEITDHAVQRYIQRHADGATYAQALLDLQRLLPEATPLKTKSVNGQSLLRVDEPPLLFVVKPDGGKIVLVTVLPKEAMELDDPAVPGEVDEVLAAYRRVISVVDREKRAADPIVQVYVNKTKAMLEKLRAQVERLSRTRQSLVSDSVKLLAKVAGDKLHFAGPMPDPKPVLIGDKDLVRQLDKTERQLADKELRLKALERQVVRQTEHGKRMVEDRDVIKAAIKKAMRAFVARKGEPDVDEVLAEIEHLGPWLVSERFVAEKEAKG